MQNKSIFLALLCAIIACITTKCSTISLISYEIRVSLKQLPLPISISSILRTSRNHTDSNKISKISIKMGHLTGKLEDYLFPRGITAYIANQTQLSDDYLTQLKSLLQISQDKRFQIYLQQENMMLISDPNDRFCTQHMEYYLRYFFPCKTFASLGLQKLISHSKLFENYNAFEFQWLANTQEIYLKIIFPKQRQIVEILKQTSCGSISVSEINKDSTISASSSFSQNIIYHASLINRWHNPRKCISHTFKFQQSQINTKVKVISILPLGFIFDNIIFYPLVLNFTYRTIKIGSNLLIIFQFLPLNLQTNQVQIQINFHSSLPPFETFQTIAGGGQEIMNIPLYFEGDRMVQLYSPIISERLLEPDFSIPFQTITFTVGIVGYLWINLWRIYKINDEKTKKS